MLQDFERELVEARRQREMEEEGGTGWHHVEIDTSAVEIKDEDKGVLDDEPVVNEGLGAALQLAQKKGTSHLSVYYGMRGSTSVEKSQ